jgi:hypothetical protein
MGVVYEADDTRGSKLDQSNAATAPTKPQRNKRLKVNAYIRQIKLRTWFSPNDRYAACVARLCIFVRFLVARSRHRQTLHGPVAQGKVTLWFPGFPTSTLFQNAGVPA